MQKKKLAIIMLAAMTANMSVTPVNALTAARNLRMVQSNQKQSNENQSRYGEFNSLNDNESNLQENIYNKGEDSVANNEGQSTEKDNEFEENVSSSDDDRLEVGQDKDSSVLESGDETDNNVNGEGNVGSDNDINNGSNDVNDEISNNVNGEINVENEVSEQMVAEEAEEAALEAEEAEVKKFELYGSSDLSKYDEAFKVQKSEIVSVKNNGSYYGDSSVDKAFDGDMWTHFETGTPNGDNFTNEIVVTFEEEKTIDRVVYAARQDYADGKGFARKVQIYASTTESGDDFRLVCSGEYNGWTEDVVQIKFAPTEFKRLKFVFAEADEDWASAAELWFYEEDKISDVMKELFTDSSKYELSSEYNDTAILNELKNEIANHPLRDKYNEDISLANQIINEGVLGEYSESKIKISDIAKSDKLNQYNEEYKISADQLKSVTNNGGHYGDSELSRLYDGDKNSHWETGTGNSDSFKNEVVFTFDEIKKIEKIIMSPRQDAWNKGFPLEYEIYGSLSEDGDDYRLITSGKSSSVLSEDVEILFQEAQFRKLKFKFVQAYEDYAAIGEISFYTKDEVTAEINEVFTDNLYSTLSEKYDSLEEIADLEEKVLNHPLKAQYMEIIEAAKALISGDSKVVSDTITLSQRGDENAKRDELRQVFAGGNVDVTGYYVMPGESFEVYLDADMDGKMPQITFSQVGEIDDSGNQRMNLTVGKNVVTAPKGTKPFAIYFTNRALPEEQSYAPKVKLAGENLKSYPVYIHGKTDAAEYIEAVKNHTGANMTEIAGERYLLSVKNSEAVIAYIDRGYSPDKTDADINKLIASFDRLAGYDVNDKKSLHRPSKALYHYKATDEGSLFACNEYINYPAETARDVLSGNLSDWGIVHEFGHQIENADMEIIEVTNNIYSTYVQRELGQTDLDFAALQKGFDKYFTYDEGTKGFGRFGEFDVSFDLEFGLFERMIVLNQIFEYFGDDIYGQANRLLRENPEKYNSAGYKQNIIMTLSEASGYDLSSHFEYYNYPMTEAAKEFTSQFKPLDKKIRYISMLDYKKGEAGIAEFTDDTKAVIEDIKRESDGFTLTLNTTNHNDAMSAYEIYRNGEFVGFSRENTYTDKADVSQEYTYEVVAYDYKANQSVKSDAVNTNASYRPELTGDENVTIAINEEFKPLNYIKAVTYDGKPIDAANIVVLENKVDNTKAGSYTVTYRVEDRGLSAEKTITVKVVSSYDYLSDSEWTSVRTDWGTPRKNSAIKGRVNGEITSFEKGFGIHANGEIVYELGEHNYSTFEALAGVDMLLDAQDNSSVKFKITGDGETLAETEVLKHSDNMVKISVPVSGVNVLKIEVSDADNGNTSDHCVIANPILITNNSKPVLEVAEDVVIKLGQSLENVVGTYKAYDIEDGDLTQNVVISGAEEVNINKAGRYEIKYAVTDSDNNTVEKTRTISVVNMKEYTSLSDVSYQTASQGWGQLGLNKSVDGNALRLTDADNKEVIYEKGLGTHSASTVTYDLRGQDFAYFSSYIGVDREMYGSAASVTFEIYLDGRKVYDSGVMYSKDAQKYVELSLAGASELKLVVTDGGNGNGSDHADWADAKLYSVNSSIDTSSLQSLLAQIASIDQSKYSAESIANLISVRDEALQALNNGYTQAEINELYQRLTQAKDSLVEKISSEKLELQQLVEQGKVVNENMSAELNALQTKLNNLQSQLNTAEGCLADEAKTAEELKEVINSLNSFMAEMGEK